MPEQGSHVVSELEKAVGLRTHHAVTVDNTLVERFMIGIGEPPDSFGDGVSYALFYSVLMRGPAIWQQIAHLLPPGGVDGGGRWSFHALPKLGSVVEAATEITRIQTKAGSRGPMIIVTARTEWRTPDDVLLAACDASAIFQ